jgi:hypothetical protein
MTLGTAPAQQKLDRGNFIGQSALLAQLVHRSLSTETIFTGRLTPALRIDKSLIMTATQTLPSELWTLTLGLCTFVPGVFDTSYLPPLSDEPRSWSTIRASIDMLKTKTSLALVCRAWNTLMTPFLFEHIILFLPTRIEPLADLLSRKHGSGARGPSGAGYYVKRIDLRFELHDGFSETWDDGIGPYATAFINILGTCPNLAIFRSDARLDERFYTVDTGWFTPRTVITSLLVETENVRLRKLRHIECFLDYDDTMDLGNSLMSSIALSKLEVLILTSASPTSPKHLQPARIPSFPLLHTVHFAKDDGYTLWSIIRWLATWDTPSLKRVIISKGMNDDMDEDDLQPLIDSHGSKLIYLDVYNGGTSGWSGIDLTCISGFTALENLVTYPMTCIVTLPPSHPTLTRISVFSTLPTESRAEMLSYGERGISEGIVALDAFISNCLQNKYPKLQSVRFLNLTKETLERGDLWSGKLARIWREWMEKFELDGVGLECNGGERVTVAPDTWSFEDVAGDEHLHWDD